MDGRDSDSEPDLEEESDIVQTDDSEEMEIIDMVDEADVRIPWVVLVLELLRGSVEDDGDVTAEVLMLLLLLLFVVVDDDDAFCCNLCCRTCCCCCRRCC